MLYMQSEDGNLHLIVLETANLEELKKGRPIKSPDGKFVVAWTPDAVWLADKIMDSGGDVKLIAQAVEESQKRPDKGPRKTHEPYVKRLIPEN